MPIPSLSRRQFLALTALTPLAATGAANAAKNNRSGNSLEPLLEPWGDLSPNGREVAFVTDQQEIYLARTDGSGSRRLVGDNSYMPAYAPDGKTIAFISAREYLDHGHTTYLIAADGTGEPRRLVVGGERGDTQHFPNWSPDGEQIAVVQWSVPGGVLLSVSGAAAKTVASGNLNCFIWSPKRKELLASGRRAGDTDRPPAASGLYRVSSDGTQWVRLLDRTPTYAFLPVWSPDGRRIAVTCDAAIYVLSTDPSDAPQRLSPNGSKDGAPAWSPSGKEIAFTSGGDLWTMRADGSKRYNVTRSGGYNSYPRWLPDGKTLIFVSRRDKGYNLYRIRADGTDLKQLTETNNVGRKASMFR